MRQEKELVECAPAYSTRSSNSDLAAFFARLFSASGANGRGDVFPLLRMRQHGFHTEGL